MLTAEQKALRKTRIGSSEVGAVLGIDPHRSPLQLWMDKRGMAREHDAAHLGWGLDVEQAILRNYCRRNGYELMAAPGTLIHPKHTHLCATPDALGSRDGRLHDINAKNVQEWRTTDWGEPGTSNAPLFYVAQITVELGILLAMIPETMHTDIEEVGDLAVSFGGRPPLGYPIPFNAELFGNLAEVCARFARDHLEGDRPPPLEGDRAAMEYVKRRFVKSTGELLPPTEIAKSLVAKLREAKERAGATEHDVEAIQAQLCALIGDAYGFEGLCTWSVVKEQRKAVTDWPLIVEQLAGMGGIDRERVRKIVEMFTREEVVKESYRRLTLAKERKAP